MFAQGTLFNSLLNFNLAFISFFIKIEFSTYSRKYRHAYVHVANSKVGYDCLFGAVKGAGKKPDSYNGESLSE